MATRKTELRSMVNGRYQILARLGGGGQGSVFRVRDQLFPDRPTALKLLGPTTPGALLRFEFEQLARLSHPHLVEVYELGMVDAVEGRDGPALGTAFLTEELVTGGPADIWARSIDTVDRPLAVARVGVAVGRALSLLHTRGLLHRDVKPSNILVSDDGEIIKLIDLGLSAPVGLANGARAGTVGYMAPEALQGFPQERSDLYSLGATLFHLLSGDRPRFGRTGDEALPAHVPEPLWAVITRLSQHSPRDRLDSARETVLALGRAVGPAILGADRAGDLIDAASESEDEGTRAARFRSAELVGRDSELRTIGEWLTRSLAISASAAPVAIVYGPPGVGKTRLARTAVVHAQIAAAENQEVPPELLTGELRELVSAAIGRDRMTRVKDLASDDRGLNSIVDAWLRGETDTLLAEEPGTGGAVLSRELARLLRTVGRTTVLLIEDADRGLVHQILGWLAEGIDDAEGVQPLAVIAEVREQRLANEIAHTNDALLLELKPLNQSEEAQLVSAVLGREPGPKFLGELHDRTGGLPLLTEAVLAALAATRGEERIEETDLDKLDLPGEPEALVVSGLLADLAPGARALVEALAVIGRPAALEDVAEVAGIDDPDELPQAAVHLRRIGLLAAGDEQRLALLGFAKDSLQQTLPRGRYKRLHRAAFDLFSSRRDADSAQLARYAARAGLKRDARDLARRAADLLAGIGDLQGAAEQLELLLEVAEGSTAAAVGVELARIHRLTGRYDRALELLDKLGQVTDPSLSARARLERAATLRLSGCEAEALEFLNDLVGVEDQAVSLEARALAARTLIDRGDLDSAARVIGNVEPTPDAAVLHSGLVSTAGLLALGRGDFEGAERFFAAGLEATSRGTEPLSHGRFLALRGMVAHRRGDWERAVRCYEAALSLADEVGDRHGAATYAVNLAAALTELDDVGAALSRYRDGLARLKRVGRPTELAHAGANYAQLLLRVGDLDGADEASRRAMDAAEDSGQDTTRALAACVRGDLLISLGQPASAVDLLLEADRLNVRMDSPHDAVTARRHLCQAYLALDDQALAAQWLERAAVTPTASAEIEHLRLDVELALAGQGDLAGALNGLLESLPGQTAKRGSIHLKAIATAARAAARLGLSTVARSAVDDVLRISARLRSVTPALHRVAIDPLEREMADIRAASAQSALEPSAAVSSSADTGWERLVRINTRLNSEHRIGPLLDLIMDTAIDITGAERGFLLVVDRKARLRIRSARNIDRERLDRDDRDYSRSVALRAYESGEPIVTIDAQEDEQFRGLHSVMALELRYILAVPLTVLGKTTGTIYVDSRGGGRFDETRLTLLRALADQAAIALTNARLTAENRRRQRRIERLNKELESKLQVSEGALERALRDLKRRTEDLTTRYSYEGIIGRSGAMAELFRTLDRITATDLPVVIQGESGTGKELVARAIHFNGPRKAAPFVAENCAAIPDTLLESALFGHVRGAFTGAIRDSQGLFVEADRGTLFLDEVGEMPLPMQTKLLRVLQEREVRPVGGTRAAKVDVRILVASNADLAALTKQRAFREDLFYRLNVIPVKLPPLRERRGDIPLLIEHFVAKHRPERQPQVTQAVLEALIDYPWPGNVRQLENELMRATVLCGPTLDIEHLSDEVLSGASQISEGPEQLDLDFHLSALKRKLIQLALKRSRGNRTKAAELLGVSRYGLQKMLARLGL